MNYLIQAGGIKDSVVQGINNIFEYAKEQKNFY